MFAFVPRKVAKSLRSSGVSSKSSKNDSKDPATSSAAAPVTLPLRNSESSSKGKGKETQATLVAEEDYAASVLLSLTEYALWADPDLRMSVESSEEGYVPLSYLLSQSTYFTSQTSTPSEAILVKAIRTHAPEMIEVRVLMSSPSKDIWYGQQPSSKVVGGYEIRRRDMESIMKRVREITKNDWDSRTLYMENIPLEYRSIPKIYRFATSLLQDSSTPTSRVQHILLPRHRQDTPEHQPKCKGFALVTFSHTEDVDFLLKQWPWRREPKGRPSDTDTNDVDRLDAVKFGFRVIEKARWEKLNEEYLAYRQRLLDDIALEESTQTMRIESAPETSAKKRRVPLDDMTDEPPEMDLSAPYPRGCLVFVRHIHPETNKTTLRKLFTHALPAPDAQTANDAIDYVDFNKGMNTCYLRLAAPQYAQQLVDFYAENPTAQARGLDSDGSTPAAGDKAITIEVVTGEREELYWNKVPEKVRRQAVEKAVGGNKPPNDVQSGGQSASDGKEGRKRKRRKG